MSPKFKLNAIDYAGIAKVIGWTVATSLSALALQMLGAFEVSGNAFYWFPIVNTLLYTIQKWLTSNKPVELGKIEK